MPMSAPRPEILITSGPTREYLDPVRYLSNASSGRMGQALAAEALRAGYAVTVVSGPVTVVYPEGARVIPVTTTEEMRDAALDAFPRCLCAIGVAAPCDYRPAVYSSSKMTKDRFTRRADSNSFFLELEETPDIFAALGGVKRADQFLVPFALETEDHHARAVQKLRRKNGDLIVLNTASAIGVSASSLEVLDPDGETVARLAGEKSMMAEELIRIIGEGMKRKGLLRDDF